MMSVLANGGEAGALILSKDWSTTSLGPIESWPKTLMSTIGMIVSSRHPMFLWWGPELIQFYNDAYAPSFGRGKHPNAMGQPGRECWPETWSIIGPQIEDVMQRKRATWHEDALVPIERNGRIEEVYWTYGYSPAFDDDGNVGGVLVVCTESTGRVLAERRAEVLGHILCQLSPSTDPEELADVLTRACARATQDVPFAVAFRRRAGACTPLDARSLPSSTLAELAAAVERHAEGVGRIDARHSTVALQTRPKVSAFVEPIAQAAIFSSPTMPEYVFVFGLSPRLPIDAAYVGFFGQILDQLEAVATRLATLHALEKNKAERETLLWELEAANRAKDEFLATVSHELRTPLTSILGWASLLRENHEPKRLEKGLAVIERNARAQAKLIEDILDVSRIISGKVRVVMRRVNPAAIAHAALETVRPIASLKNIALHVRIDPDIGDLIADEDRLQQIVWNLLSNAVKFTPRGGEVFLSAARDGGEVTLTVRDTGKGIEPEVMPYIFERFRQGDTSTTKEHGGLGLGLAIVRHLLDLHGGSITATSDGKDRGATFEVRIPIHAIEPMHAPSAGAGSPRADDACLHGVQVLVLEDHDDARELTAMALAEAGATVMQAGSARRALGLLESEPFDVVVSDIGLPGEDGYSFIERVRAMVEKPNVHDVPALALTAFARPEDRTRALEAGFQEHIPKPVDPRKLVEAVVGLVAR
jgi:signal transduction histidine kinase